MSSPTHSIFQPGKVAFIMAMLVLPQALGKAAAKYFFSPSGLVTPTMSMCSASHPSSRALTEAMRRARHFLSEEGVAAVAAAKGPDGALFGIMDDVFVVGTARPSGIFLPWLERNADGVVTRDECAVVAKSFEDFFAHARHDAHVADDIGRVGDLNADE